VHACIIRDETSTSDNSSAKTTRLQALTRTASRSHQSSGPLLGDPAILSPYRLSFESISRCRNSGFRRLWGLLSCHSLPKIRTTTSGFLHSLLLIIPLSPETASLYFIRFKSYTVLRKRHAQLKKNLGFFTSRGLPSPRNPSLILIFPPFFPNIEAVCVPFRTPLLLLTYLLLVTHSRF